MKLSAAFRNFDDINLALTGLSIFIAVFVGSLIWVYFVQSQKHYDQMSHLPLQDEVKS